MGWLLVLCILIATPADSASEPRLRLLDQPALKLPPAPRPKKFTSGAWNQLEPVSSAIEKMNPRYTTRTPIRVLMTDTFFYELRHSSLQTRFSFDMSHSRLPFNLTERELAFFEDSPDHPLFDSVCDLPLAGLGADHLKSRLVTKGVLFVIDIAKGLQQPPLEKRLLSYKVGQKNMRQLVEALAQHLEKVAHDPFCKKLFEQDRTL